MEAIGDDAARAEGHETRVHTEHVAEGLHERLDQLQKSVDGRNHEENVRLHQQNCYEIKAQIAQLVGPPKRLVVNRHAFVAVDEGVTRYPVVVNSWVHFAYAAHMRHMSYAAYDICGTHMRDRCGICRLG